MNRILTTAIALVAVTLASAAADASLLSRLGGKAQFDDVANLTWLQDANYAKTSGHSADGLMTWAEANAWAGSLNIDGVTGWRLPGGPMAFGYNQTASEMGDLFYNVLGGVADTSITSVHNANYDLFSNLNAEDYWSGVELDSSFAWLFGFFDGVQTNDANDFGLFGWAVHSGDVGLRPVPLPGALGLLGLALGGLGFRRPRGA